MMKLTYIGHSCFRFDFTQTSVIFDPYEPGSVPGLADVRETADLVLCSHEHHDHNSRDSVQLTGKKSDAVVETINTWHDDAQGQKRGPNTIHIVTCDGLKIAHLGDLGCGLTEDQLKKLSDVDILMIPCGGFFTIDAAQAAELTKQIAPKLAIPMHFRSEEGNFGYPVIGTSAEYTDFFKDAEIITESIIEEPFPCGVVRLLPRNCLNGR